MEVRELGARYLVQPTHKQTEVGQIPADWSVDRLEELASVTSGKRIPLGRSLTIDETPHPYIRVTDMRPGSIHLGEIRYVPSDVFPFIKRYCIFNEDIFISVAGTLGIVGKIPPALDGANLTENANRIWSITCSRDYLLHVLSSPVVQRVIESSRTVGAQPKLALVKIRKFSIPMPASRKEQDAIAEALSDADALIESLEQVLAKKRQIKQGAMQELLTGQRRLPGFEGENLKTFLGKLGSCHRGVAYNPTVDLSVGDTPQSVRLLRSNNVQGSAIQLDDLQYVNERRVSLQQVLREDDVVICMANGSRDLVGKAARFSIDDGQRYTFGAFMGCYRPAIDMIDPVFAYYLFQTNEYRSQIGVLLAGSSINNLSPAAIEATKVCVPPMRSEQTAIATALSDMDAELSALEARLAKTRLLKQGMAQALLTGRIRLV